MEAQEEAPAPGAPMRVFAVAQPKEEPVPQPGLSATIQGLGFAWPAGFPGDPGRYIR